MTFTRHIIIVSIVVAFVDFKFSNGRLVDALWDQTRHLGYSLNDQFSGVTDKISPFH